MSTQNILPVESRPALFASPILTKLSKELIRPVERIPDKFIF